MGSADVANLARSVDLLAPASFLSIHIRDFIDAFRNGLAYYLNAIENDPVMQRKFDKGAGLWFGNLGIDQMNDFLKVADR